MGPACRESAGVGAVEHQGVLCVAVIIVDVFVVVAAGVVVVIVVITVGLPARSECFTLLRIYIMSYFYLILLHQGYE